MTDRPTIDTSVPQSARIYNYIIGGKDYYEADRAAGDAASAAWPNLRVTARANRDFMHRTTDWLAHHGVRQFLDIGTGIPAEPNLHQIAQEVAPDARVVYVDHDPIVLAHARALLHSSREGRTAYVDADVTEPDTILSAPGLLETLDLSQPVALSLNAILHFVPGERAYDIVDTLVGALSGGSFLVMSHGTPDLDPDGARRITEVYRKEGIPLTPRTRQQFERFFTGLDVVDPGVVLVHHWRREGIELPRGMDAQVSVYGAVARKGDPDPAHPDKRD